MASRPVTVRLVGGLGNQLFGYYAGAALAAHRGVPLRLDTSHTRHGVTDHGIEILKFDLPGTWLSDDRLLVRLAPPGSVHCRAFDRLLRQVPIGGKLLRIHHESPDDDLSALLEQPAGTRLRGYFQSWQIVEYAVKAGYPRRPTLRSPSPWLDGITRRIRAEQPIAIHVRRGDYLSVGIFETLGPDYYEQAIQSLREQGFSGPLWLFSDDFCNARTALGMFTDVELIRSPDGAAAEMLAMSLVPARIIANSTFSWWSAWWSAERAVTVMPGVWFVDDRTPSRLRPGIHVT